MNALLAHGAHVNARMTKRPPSFATGYTDSVGATPFLLAASVDVAAADTTAPAAKAKSGSRSLRILLGVFAIGAVLGAVYYISHVGRESTDDAQVDAEVVPVPARTSGTVVNVLFNDNQEVKAGQVLAELDPAYPQAKLAQAEAALASAKASADAADAQEQVTEASAKGQKSVAEASLSGAAVSVKSTSSQIAEAQADPEEDSD